MKKVNGFLLSAVLMFCTVEAKAQENEFNTSVSADVVSQYIWRGQDLGNVSLQPTLGLSYKGLSLNAWGNVGLSESSDVKEIDLTLNYKVGGFNLGVTDYWTNNGLDAKNRYFKYEAHQTNHVIEANVGYDFNFADIQIYTNLAGNDGVNNDGKRAYSTYAEINVPFTFAKVDWTATAGVVPFATDYYEADGFAFTNLSLTANKDIKITDTFSIPVFAGINTNPYKQKAYLVFGLTLQP